MDIVKRLNGVYRTPITDGLGPAGGEEPDNPNEFVRTFQTPPIQKEAAATITALRKRVEELEGALEPLARKKVPQKPQGNAGIYVLSHDEIRRARATLGGSDETL